MKKSLSSVQEQLATLRVGRATPDMLDRVLVDYYDTPTPLKQLASVTCPTATQLVVDVYDKSALGDVEKGLMASDIGMTPSNDGSVIRLNVPQLTKDRRVELAKTAKGIGEGGKTALRNVRRDAIDKIKKAVKAAGLGAKYLWVEAPDFDALEKRLRGRGTETEEKVQKRMATARRETDYARPAKGPKPFDYYLVNDELEAAHDRLRRGQLHSHFPA